jgi:hypothetical protein
MVFMSAEVPPATGPVRRVLNHFCKGEAKVVVNWKTNHITTKKNSGPNTGASRMRSMESWIGADVRVFWASLLGFT